MGEDLLKGTGESRTDSYEPLRPAEHKPTVSATRQADVGTAKVYMQRVDSVMACRYELKYLISESAAAAVAHYVGPYLHLDRYCRHRPGKSYPIVSLYLDSADLKLCKQTLEGRKNRFKLRVRSYTDDPNYPRFFEIKRRLNNIILKSRARVLDHSVEALLSGGFLPPGYCDGDGEALKQFQFYMKSIAARPVILVRYMRQAYEGDLENRVRVTFDRQLCCCFSDCGQVRINGSGWQQHSFNSVILEIKFTGRYPSWLKEMTRHLNLRQTSVSKYVSSVRQLCSMGFGLPQLRP